MVEERGGTVEERGGTVEEQLKKEEEEDRKEAEPQPAGTGRGGTATKGRRSETS